ncbi:hypothetical protein MOQ_004998 [Trypanosoma cruzi marinkellei]|uniref:Uncharacterized protein n=1 Tax=Trypanosoma cruzi marinkellei TaxID=85056 RepID=K2N8S6_TRYCR|nr:hypothetical protein MOQ_004998 [Trypanosoma cruzi marinkellei]
MKVQRKTEKKKKRSCRTLLKIMKQIFVWFFVLLFCCCCCLSTCKNGELAAVFLAPLITRMLRRVGGMCGGVGLKKNTLGRGISAARRGGPFPLSVSPSAFVSAAFRFPTLGPFCRRIHTRAELDVVDDTVEEDGVTLEDYEELLLHSAPSETLEKESHDGGVIETETTNNINQPPLSSTMRLVNNILELLPSDGTGIRLTTITPLLDVEAVSELFGSVLAFVQLFPHRFRSYQVEEKDGSLRWYVSRVQAARSSPPSISVEEATKKRECGGENEKKIIQTQVRVRLHSAETNFSEKRLSLVLQQLQDMLPKDKPTSTTGLLQTFPMELQDSIRELGGGLLRLLKNTLAQDYVDLSEDTNFVSVKGIISSQGITTYHCPSKQAGHKSVVPLMPVADYADDAWNVELNLDDDDDDVLAPDDDDFDDVEPKDAFLQGVSVATAAVSNTIQHQQQANNTSSMSSASSKVPERLEKHRTPPPLPSKRKDLSSSKARMSSEELLKTHTTMALLRGRRSPSEMLDLFVECVPTSYVPVQQIKVTDALARVLGPRNTLYKVIKIYSYYFDRNKESDSVRLKPTLQHERLGAANVLYDAVTDGASSTGHTQRKLQETSVTRAFPVLNTPIRTKMDLSTTRKKGGLPLISPTHTTSTVVCSNSECFALLKALRHDRYVDISEWAQNAGVSTSTLTSFTEGNSNHHYLLTQNCSGKEDGMLLWRLRPYWLAPGCAGELGSVDSREAAAIEQHLKPIWISIDRLLQKLPLPSQNSVQDVCREYGGVGPWLRQFGRMCWVDKEGKKVRKYCAAAELDDIQHAVVQYLHSTLPTTFVNLKQDIIPSKPSSDRQNEEISTHHNDGILQLIDHGLTIARRQALASTSHEEESVSEKKANQENLYLFLRRHPQQLDVKEEEGIIWAAKHSFFGKNTSK